jgi:hypothetical protein
MGYVEEAQRRARRRRSGWNLLLIPALFACWLGGAYFLASALSALHQLRYPSQHLAASEGIGTILVVISALMAAFVPGMLISNIIVWLVLPARRALDREAKSVPRSRFRESQRGLLRIAVYLVPVSLAIGVVGAWLPWDRS